MKHQFFVCRIYQCLGQCPCHCNACKILHHQGANCAQSKMELFFNHEIRHTVGCFWIPTGPHLDVAQGQYIIANVHCAINVIQICMCSICFITALNTADNILEFLVWFALSLICGKFLAQLLAPPRASLLRFDILPQPFIDNFFKTQLLPLVLYICLVVPEKCVRKLRKSLNICICKFLLLR